MARALFICEVVIDSKGRAAPATEEIRNNLVTGNFPCVWTITTFPDTRRTAIGLAEVTAAQLAALQADTRIRATSLAIGWETATWSTITLATRNNFLAFLDGRDVDRSDIINTMTIKELVDTLCNRLRPGRRLSHLQTELSMNFGVSSS